MFLVWGYLCLLHYFQTFCEYCIEEVVGETLETNYANPIYKTQKDSNAGMEYFFELLFLFVNKFDHLESFLDNKNESGENFKEYLRNRSNKNNS